MEETFEDMESFSRGFQAMNEARKEKLFCDVILKSGQKTFHCHRVVLAAMIPYFYSMFTMDLLENKQQLIEMKDIDSDSLESLLEFAYSGIIKINVSNVQSLLLTSSYLQINSVNDICANYLIKRLDINNALELKCLAESVFCRKLLEFATNFIDRNYFKISTTPHFMNLSAQQLIEIIQRDQICVLCEVEVYESVMRWVRHDETTRSEKVDELLAQVRLPLVPFKYLNDKISKDHLMQTSQQCSAFLQEAREYNSTQKKGQTPPHSQRTTPRTSSGLLYAIGGLDNKNKFLSRVEVYCPVRDVWRPGKSMPTARSNFGTAVHHNRMFTIGGLHCKMSSVVEVYNPYSESWCSVSSLSEAKSSLNACTHGSFIYACGGLNQKNNSLNVVERYCLDRDKWEIDKSMNVQMAEGGLVSLNGCLWALGGCDGSSWLSSVESYDPRTSRWEFQKKMSVERCGFGVATLNDKIYVCGGEDERSLEEFDPRNKRWRFLKSMNADRWGMTLVTYVGRLYAIGGRDDLHKLDSVEVYEHDSNTWYYVSPMSMNRFNLGGVTLLSP